MAINQISTANTFQQWLTATQALITTANTLTDGNGASFVANTKLDISGSQAQLNVRTSASINTLYANNAVLGGFTNVTTLNVSSTGYIGGDLTVDGNVTVSGNIILDSIGFDDIIANGSITAAENLTIGGFSIITGNTTLSNVTATYGNYSTANITLLTGSANTALYSNIATVNAYAISAGSYANSAFVKANASFIQANSAYASQNSTGVYANSSFEAANNAGVYANSAFNAANTAADNAIALSIALG
jgi:cytoskeletal protein CcmA (bactofilin family)